MWKSLQNRPKLDSMRSLKSIPRKTPSNMRMQFVITDASIVAVPAVLCLGTFCFYMDLQKEETFLEEQSKHEPIPLPSNIKNLENKEMKYRPIQVIGEFDHMMERYIGPRRFLKTMKRDARIFTPSEKLGMLVITPFTIKDTGQRILINRGWIPVTQQDPNSRLKGQIKGEVKLVGINIQHSEQDSLTSSSSENPNVFSKRDLESLAQSTNSLPIYLDADVASTVEGGPVGGQTATDVKPYSSYCLALLYAVCLLFYMGQLKKRKSANSNNKINSLFT
ncbi:surfeit locus protein 1-like isoform X2 [Pecten maximus]|uniref:surfeit locus protein 1-like isoform X2 n=1 Tax=Pecten maximus TaxID=6579 RepID=UPI001458F822|nr:surfeit locus protein 1-like isoform X2 [Pecten maximus]